MYSAVDEQLIGRLYNCTMSLQTPGHPFAVQAAAGGVRRYIDAPTGNMSPTSEAEECCQRDSRHLHQRLERFRRSDVDAWSSDEEHEPPPHRQGEEAEAERMLRKRKQ